VHSVSERPNLRHLGGNSTVVGHSLLLARLPGTHWVTICVIQRLALTVSDVYSRLVCFQSTSTSSALQVFIAQYACSQNASIPLASVRASNSVTYLSFGSGRSWAHHRPYIRNRTAVTAHNKFFGCQGLNRTDAWWPGILEVFRVSTGLLNNRIKLPDTSR